MGGQLLRVFCLLVLMKLLPQVKSQIVNITRIKDAVEKGAVCLDGSPGTYYFAQGSGEGVNNWIIFLEGGGWCVSKDDCLYRSRQLSGSSKNAPPTKYFGTILSPNQKTNPDFHNWNIVYIRYCDGASFLAYVEAVDPETKLYRRGRRIFNTIMEELIATKGMGNAANALLVGNSAGGLATILNCDHFHSFLPSACKLKCISDSGFFIHAEDLPGVKHRENYFASLTAFHELTKSLPKSCTSRMAPSLCLFPENVVDDIQIPLFLLNSDFDRFQINTNLKPNPPDDQGWTYCTQNFKSLQNCTANQLKLIKDFRTAFLKTLEGLSTNLSRGFFISSCYIHDFVYRQVNWQIIPTLQNKTIARAFGDWYSERSNVQLIDAHPYPLNCNITENGQNKE